MVKGSKASPETKRKLSEAQARRWRDPADRAKREAGLQRAADTRWSDAGHREVEAARKRARATHGHRGRDGTRSPTYRSWEAMLYRCSNPNCTSWRNYGGRGITVCAEWRSFANFLADMGEKPDGLTLDRIDNDGNYEPGNCRWATRSQQMKNRRSTAYGHRGKNVRKS